MNESKDHHYNFKYLSFLIENTCIKNDIRNYVQYYIYYTLYSLLSVDTEFTVFLVQATKYTQYISKHMYKHWRRSRKESIVTHTMN